MGKEQPHAGHSHAGHSSERALTYALLLTIVFLLAEVVGGVLTGSLALISDAAHMLTDSVALAIALAAIRIGRRPADARRSFGYYRFETLAAAFNAMLLFLVALYILYAVYQRLQHPPQIASLGMLAVAVVGLVVNLISMRILSPGKDSSLNLKGAYLEVWSDMLGSVGVIIGALVIHLTGWTWVDSAIAIAIGLWILPRTWILLKDSVHVLLEGVPEHIELPEVEAALAAVPGVESVHDLHIWVISNDKISLTVHVVCDQETAETPRAAFALLHRIRDLLAERFAIRHSTVQLEQVPCEHATDEHLFAPPHDHARDYGDQSAARTPGSP